MNYEILQEAFEATRRKWPDCRPHCGLVLGSGWGDVIDAFVVKNALSYADVPGLGKPGVQGHSGRLLRAEAAGLETLIFQGRRHWYEGEGWTPIATPIYVLKQWGVSFVVLTNAAGGIRAGLHPGDLMIISDHINHMGVNPLVGAGPGLWGPQFPDQSRVYDLELRDLMQQAASQREEPISTGVYLASSGPSYETPAEIRAFKTLGADAVGMSTIPEAILASASGMRVLGLSCISNYAAGISPHALSHEEVTEATQSAMPRMKALIRAFWEKLGAVVQKPA